MHKTKTDDWNNSTAILIGPYCINGLQNIVYHFFLFFYR